MMSSARSDWRLGQRGSHGMRHAVGDLPLLGTERAAKVTQRLTQHCRTRQCQKGSPCCMSTHQFIRNNRSAKHL